MFGLFDLLTWPLILLGLLRGSYYSYKCVHENYDDERKKQQLQYWVVFCAIIFFFPWFDALFGWFIFGGLISIAKFIFLIMVVVSRSKYTFLYLFIDEQFVGFLEPWVKKILSLTENYRKQVENQVALVSTAILLSIINLLINEMSDQNVLKLKKMIGNTMDKIESKTK